MKNLIKTIILLTLISGSVFGQKYMTKNGVIAFLSDAPAEKIYAINNQVATVLDISTGEWAFKVLMKSFEFEKALMQEHFNENYVESNKFPNATFKGKIVNLSEINFSKNGKYNAIVEGDLTIHGVTKKVKAQGNIEVKEGKITADAKFLIALKDYDVKIPGAVVKNIAETVGITVVVSLDKIK